MSSHTGSPQEADVIRADDLSSIAADARNQARQKMEAMLNAIAARSVSEINRKRSEGAAIERSDWCFPASTDERAELCELWLEGQIYEDFLRRSNAALEEAHYGSSSLRRNSKRQLVGTLASAGLKLVFFALMAAAAAKVLMT